MAKRAILHIGGEKTGTTTLQHFLSRNAVALKRAGFHYPCEPDDICSQNAGHFPVAACLIDSEVEFVNEQRQRTLSSVLSTLTQRCRETDDTIILSCEHFSSRLSQPQQLQALRRALATDDIKIVFYAREPSELALAAWSTRIRGGARDKFDVESITPTNRYFNHLETLDLWAEVFGRENVIAREYDRVSLIGGDIRNDFCDVLGVKLENPLFDKDQNLSLDAQRLEVLRHINNALPFFDECIKGWRRAQEIRQLVSKCIPEGLPLDALMSERDATLIKSRFSDVNRELNERYFSGGLSRKWFGGRSGSDSQVSISRHREQPDLVPVLRDTIIRIAEVTREYEIRHRESSSPRVKRKLKNFFRALRRKLLPSDDAGPAAYR